MKTTAELTAELELLNAALKEATTLANERSTASYRLQAATSQNVLGLVGVAEVQAAHDWLDRTLEALPRVANLKQAIADNEQLLVEARGRERRTHCEGIKAEHQQLFDTFKADSEKLLATFKEMQTLNFTYMGLVGRELHPSYFRDLHLPAVSGSLASRSNISTGSE